MTMSFGCCCRTNDYDDVREKEKQGPWLPFSVKVALAYVTITLLLMTQSIGDLIDPQLRVVFYACLAFSGVVVAMVFWARFHRRRNAASELEVDGNSTGSKAASTPTSQQHLSPSSSSDSSSVIDVQSQPQQTSTARSLSGPAPDARLEAKVATETAATAAAALKPPPTPTPKKKTTKKPQTTTVVVTAPPVPPAATTSERARLSAPRPLI